MSQKYWGMEEKVFLTLLHLSQLAGFVIPFAGLILPIVMWVTNKDESATIDAHGKVIVNWLITMLIAYAICFVLTFILIGALLMVILFVVHIVFIIIAAIKANNGELWPYPFSLNLIK
ncbi:MAG: DUF4870 domain-containing protein [Pseudomonadota bacterium]